MRRIRRSVTALILALALAGPAFLSASDDHAKGGAVRATDAWQRLREGNERFARGLVLHPDAQPARLRELAGGQHPFATVVSCSDSRVPLELVFDQGFGDLFVERVAGNAQIGEFLIGSTEYGVLHLGTNLVVVLGHEKCGAVTAAVKGYAAEDTAIDELVAHLTRSAEAAHKQAPAAAEAEWIRLAIAANVEQTMEDLLTHSPRVAQGVRDGIVQVVGGVYSLDTGRVQWLGEHPRQAAILQAAAPAAQEHAPAEGHH